MVDWLGRHVAFARADRKPRATAVLGGFACIASRKPRTTSSGVSPSPGPGGAKYGAWSADPCRAGSVWTSPETGSVEQPHASAIRTARPSTRSRHEVIGSLPPDAGRAPRRHGPPGSEGA